MTTETLTVHRALSELKTIGDRIDKATNAIFVNGNKHSNDKINGMPIDEFKKSIVANYQKVNDLIARRNAIKKAVVLSNAVTKVTVNGEAMSVADAIERKQHGMDYQRCLLKTMNDQFKAVQYNIERNSGEALEKRAEQYVLSVIQAQPRESKLSVDNDAMKSLRAEYIKNNTYDLIDPIGIVNEMEKLSDDINAFSVELDAALSTSNALTTLTIEY